MQATAAENLRNNVIITDYYILLGILNHICINIFVYYIIRHQRNESNEITKIIITNKITKTFHTDVGMSAYITYISNTLVIIWSVEYIYVWLSDVDQIFKKVVFL